MKVLQRTTTPDGMKLQLEDWSADYSYAKRNATIGFYPMAQENIYVRERFDMPPYPRKGKTFRASFDFTNEGEARKAFNSIASGEKSFLCFMDYYNGNVVAKDDFIKAVAGQEDVYGNRT